MNSTFVHCSFCGFETQQKEIENNGLKKKTCCLVCQNTNIFELCRVCGAFYHIEKGCNCQKEK